MTTFEITSRFGDISPVRGSRPHTGIDIAMPEGTELRSIVEGTVSKIVKNGNSIGNAVYIMGGDGKEYIYGHLSSIAVKLGEKVNVASVIGASGNTGNSTGPHLHFAIKDNGLYINPDKDVPMVLETLKIDGSNAGGIFENLEGFNMVDRIADSVVEGMKERLSEALMGTWELFKEALLEFSTIAALYGGAALIIARMCGIKKSMPYFILLQIINIFIKGMLL